MPSRSHAFENSSKCHILESSSKCCAIQIATKWWWLSSWRNFPYQRKTCWLTINQSMERLDTTWYILATHDASGSLPPPGQTANGSMSGDPNPSSWTGFGDIILKRLMAMAMDSSILFGRKYFFKWASFFYYVYWSVGVGELLFFFFLFEVLKTTSKKYKVIIKCVSLRWLISIQPDCANFLEGWCQCYDDANVGWRE